MTITYEQISGFKVIHNIPVLSDEQKEELKRDIVKKIYNVLAEKN